MDQSTTVEFALFGDLGVLNQIFGDSRYEGSAHEDKVIIFGLEDASIKLFYSRSV